jgi:glycosyltransferase involved in cell wall biosynthesis
MAVEALAELKRGGDDPVLLTLGGIEPHKAQVFQRAHQLRLVVHTVTAASELTAFADALAAGMPADILDVTSRVPLPLLRAIYGASDAVLANSGHEPFGLVGLEAMAASAVAITGGTGEDYAVHLQNAIVLDTADPLELAWYVRSLKAQPALARSLARAAHATARRFTWERALGTLLEKIAFLATRQGVHRRPTSQPLKARPITMQPSAVVVA